MGNVGARNALLLNMRVFSLCCLSVALFLASAGPGAARDAKTPAWRTFSTQRNHDATAQVKAIQFLLRGRGFYALQPDGVYGSQTAKAVKAFQRARGLTADGVVGPQTWPHLMVELRRGARGDFVRAAQILIREISGHSAQAVYPNFPVDGVFGPQTEAATRDAQHLNNWFETRGPENGVFGREVWQALTDDGGHP